MRIFDLWMFLVEGFASNNDVTIVNIPSTAPCVLKFHGSRSKAPRTKAPRQEAPGIKAKKKNRAGFYFRIGGP